MYKIFCYSKSNLPKGLSSQCYTIAIAKPIISANLIKKTAFSILLQCFLILFSISAYSNSTNRNLSENSVNNSFNFSPLCGPTDTICKGDTVTLSASNPFALSYSWTPGYNISSLTIPNPKVYPNQTTTYHVTIYGITNNLIPNGDFSQGNTGFTSGYTYTTNLWPEATYYVGTNPFTYHANFAPCTDHTTGTGNMMIVNGASVTNTNIWQKNVTVNPYSIYVFSCWLTSVTPTFPAELQFFVNGVQIGAVFNATPINCNWNMFYNTWPSGAATTANIAIKNQNSALSGNDFAIDDLYFAELIEIYDSTKIVVEKPVISLGNDTSICKGDTLTLSPGMGFAQYLWSNNSTLTSLKAATTGNYWVKVTTQSGCKASDTVHLTINPLPIITTKNDTICIGDTANLFASGANSYIWSNGLTSQTISVHPTITTNYNVIATSNAGCKDSSFATALVHQLPIIDITPPQTVCEGNAATLTASGGIYYLWDNGKSTATINVNPSINTSFNVEVTDTNGCKNDTLTSVSVIPNPIAIITADVDSVCVGNPIVLSASGGNSFRWNNNEHTSSIKVYPTLPTTYSCTVSNTINGTICSNTSNYSVYAEDCNTLYIPNAFTTKGITQTFKPIGIFPSDTEYYFAIFNKWGQLIFETTNFEIGWDGSYNGERVQYGVYVYYVKVRFGGQLRSFERKGIVTFIE
ncbi:MAG: gliding motility-associated C-terminal domain-containing protein [Bacteroidota bacterium]